MSGNLITKRMALVYEASKLFYKGQMNYRELRSSEENRLNELMQEIDVLSGLIGDGITSTLGIKKLEEALLFCVPDGGGEENYGYIR